MGVGKTAVGRQLARVLGREFIDSDREIERHAGATVSLIFELEGESGFRRRERSMIHRLTRREGIILATGGGAVLNRKNRANLSRRGIVVYLHAPIPRLMERTAGNQNRPLLQTADPYGRLAEIVKERDPLYRRVADLIVDTDGQPPRHLANHIARLISQ